MSSDGVKHSIPCLQHDKQKRNVFVGLLLMVLENQSLVRKSSQQYRSLTTYHYVKFTLASAKRRNV